MCAGIAIAFLLSGADDIAGNSTVDTGLFECLEGFFTRRSSPEWKVRIATRAPGLSIPGSFSRNSSRTVSSWFTSMRSAWNTRASDFFRVSSCSFAGSFLKVFESSSRAFSTILRSAAVVSMLPPRQFSSTLRSVFRSICSVRR